MRVRQVVTGGQTGVDQAALEAAIWLGLEHGGWCPQGRRCEDGVIPRQYRLQESHSPNYAVRTEQNVVDSDGTLILYEQSLSGGTAFTRKMAVKHDRPHLLADLTNLPDRAAILDWLVEQEIEILNVAGPRESSAEGIGQRALAFLVELLADAPADGNSSDRFAV